MFHILRKAVMNRSKNKKIFITKKGEMQIGQNVKKLGIFVSR